MNGKEYVLWGQYRQTVDAPHVPLKIAGGTIREVRAAAKSRKQETAWEWLLIMPKGREVAAQ